MRLSTPALALLAALTLGACANPALPPASAPVADADITRGVKTAIDGSAELDAADIDVATRQGIVQLSGFVSSPDSVSTAAMVARTVKGVKSVKNELRLK